MDIGKRIEEAKDFGADRNSREILEQELRDNADLLKATEAQVKYLGEIIKSPDPALVKEDPNFVTDLKARLGEAVQEKQRLTAEKERIEGELSAK